MYKKYAKIRIRPIVYETNTNGEYELDTNGDKIVLISPEDVTGSDEYDTLIEIEEYFYE